jgi:hypothetical protein
MAEVHYAGLFPFCATQTDDSNLVGSGTIYPVGFTLDEFCYFYWKIKKFKFTGDVYPSPPNDWHIDDCLDYYPLYTGPFSPYDHNPPISGYFIPTNELDLVCNWTQDHFIAFEGRGYGILIFYSSFVNMPNVYFYDNKYWPSIQIVGPGFSSGYYDIPKIIGNPSPCTFLGKNIDMFNNGSPQIPPNFSLNITVCEEWPYNP